jgi:hypothetical protein
VWSVISVNRRRAVACSLLAAALGIGVGATDLPASNATRPAPGTPDPKAMVLVSSDLGGARVTAQRYFKDADFPSVISYERELEEGASRGIPLLWADSQAEVGTNAPTTERFLATQRRIFGTKEFRRLLAESLAEELELESVITNLRIGRPRNLGVGAGSFDLLITLRVLGLGTHFHIAVFRVERVLGLVSAIGEPGRPVPLSVMTRLATVMKARMRAELTPRSIGLPAISGIPAGGQTLMATPGTWRGSPTSFAYQWLRCDPAGSACTTVPGATSQTYPIADSDLGSTMRVTVSARNSVGSASATSAPTAVVSGFVDTFTGDRVSAFWSVGVTGNGPTVGQTNGQLEVTLPAGTTLGSAGYANAFAFSRCRFPGDFDMEVDYRLLSGLLPIDGVHVGFDAAELTGDAYSGQHGMFVSTDRGAQGISTHFGAVNDFVPDSSTSGTLRLVRTTTAGVTTVTASRLTGAPWSFTSLPFAPPTSQAVNLNVFTSRAPLPTEIKVAYDNFRIRSGAFTCP